MCTLDRAMSATYFRTLNMPFSLAHIYAGKPFLCLLLILTVHMEELYRTRVRNQMQMIFAFRQYLLPPATKIIRCFQLSTDFVQHAASWLRQFCHHNRNMFPPSHCPHSPIVEAPNPTLATRTLNLEPRHSHGLPVSCICQTYKEWPYVCSGITGLRFMDWSVNLANTIWPSKDQVSQSAGWRTSWELPETVENSWNTFLISRWKSSNRRPSIPLLKRFDLFVVGYLCLLIMLNVLCTLQKRLIQDDRGCGGYSTLLASGPEPGAT